MASDLSDQSKATAAAAYERPANLLYALDEWPPWNRLALIGLQFAVDVQLGCAGLSDAQRFDHAIDIRMLAAALGREA